MTESNYYYLKFKKTEDTLLNAKKRDSKFIKSYVEDMKIAKLEYEQKTKEEDEEYRKTLELFSKYEY